MNRAAAISTPNSVGQSVARWVSRGSVQLALLLVVSTVAGAAISVAPRATVLALGFVPALLMLMALPTARLAWFVIGGMLVFQSQDDNAKAIYVAGCIFCAVLIQTQAQTAERDGNAFRAPRWAMALMLVVMVGSGLVAFSGGTPISQWLRDALPYLMLAIAPMFGEDAGRHLRPTTIRWGIGIIGAVAALGYAVDFLGRRNVSSLNVERLMLTTTLVPALGFAFAIVYSYYGPNRRHWMALAVFIPAALLVTGTRTNLVLFAGLIGLVASWRHTQFRLARLAGRLAVLAVGTAALIWLMASVLITRDGFLSSRVRILTSVVTQGGDADGGSFQDRRQDYEWALDAWLHQPFLGTGPGFRYPNGLFTLDTPLVTLAKFGVVGTAVNLLFLWVLYRRFARTAAVTGWTPIHTAMRCFAVIAVFIVPFGSPLEDKGLSLSLALLGAALVAMRTDSIPQAPDGYGSTDRNSCVEERIL